VLRALSIAAVLVGCEPIVEPSGVPLPDCADPVDSPGGFIDGTPGSGVDFVHTSDDAFILTPGDFLMPTAESLSAGVVAADFDQDGFADLYLPQLVGSGAVYWGNGDGTFEVGPADDAALGDELSTGASAADFDGDGDLDLAVMSLAALHILELDGRTFTDVTAALGVVGGPGWGGTPSWGDFDGDGDLDLYEGRQATAVRSNTDVDAAPDAFWRNDGDGFTDVIDQLPFPEGEDGLWLHGRFEDFDRDGDVDLFAVNDFGDVSTHSLLWENGGPDGDGWAWTDRLEGSGVGPLTAPMGLAVRDFDGDGGLDLWFSDIGGAPIYRSVGDWDWVDVGLVWAPEAVHTEADISWSVVDIDLDGDGQPGVLVTYGPLPCNKFGEPDCDYQQRDRFFDGVGDGVRFEEQPAVWPSVPDGNARGVGLADFNEDGVPDVLIGRVRQAPSVMLGRCTANARLVVRLSDGGSNNRFGVGAWVEVRVGDVVQTQAMVAGGRGTFSGSDPALFFGLGLAEVVDSVTVHWPGGEEQIVETVCAGCELTVVRE
jgi:enediyne biosynthesis protein E4